MTKNKDQTWLCGIYDKRHLRKIDEVMIDESDLMKIHKNGDWILDAYKTAFLHKTILLDYIVMAHYSDILRY